MGIGAWLTLSNAIETSLRRALAKGDAADPDFRLQIYEAAERALLRLEEDATVDPAATEGRREQLIAAIEAIEHDHLPRSAQSLEEGEDEPQPGAPEGSAEAVAGDSAAPPSAGAEGPDKPHSRDAEDDDAAGEAADAPPRSVEHTPDDAASQEPQPAETPEAEAPDRRTSPRLPQFKPLMRRGDPDAPRDGVMTRRVVPAIIVLLLVFLLAVGVWLLLPFFSSGTPETSGRAADPAEPKMSIEDAIRSADTGGTSGVAAPAAWTEVFSGKGAVDAAVVAGTAEAAEAGGEPAARIDPPEAGTDGQSREVAFTIPADIARRFAGRKVTGELTVASPDEASRTFTVRCLFGGETVCGRQRFTAAAKQEPFLIQMDMPASVEGAGELAIDSSIGTGAKDLLVTRFRLRPAE